MWFLIVLGSDVGLRCCCRGGFGSGGWGGGFFRISVLVIGLLCGEVVVAVGGSGCGGRGVCLGCVGEFGRSVVLVGFCVGVCEGEWLAEFRSRGMGWGCGCGVFSLVWKCVGAGCV